MSLAGLLNKTFALYRKTVGSSYPPTETWASVATIPCYKSDTTITTVNSDGAHIPIRVTRFRTEPYAFIDGDRIYFESHVYTTDGNGLGYEDIDGLGLEAVTIGQIMNDSAKTDMGIA